MANFDALHPIVKASLIDLFMHLADTMDVAHGEQPDMKRLRKAYRAELRKPEVLAFYCALVDETSSSQCECRAPGIYSSIQCSKRAGHKGPCGSDGARLAW